MLCVFIMLTSLSSRLLESRTTALLKKNIPLSIIALSRCSLLIALSPVAAHQRFFYPLNLTLPASTSESSILSP
jgi:hypothetical protein